MHVLIGGVSLKVGWKVGNCAVQCMLQGFFKKHQQKSVWFFNRGRIRDAYLASEICKEIIKMHVLLVMDRPKCLFHKDKIRFNDPFKCKLIKLFGV